MSADLGTALLADMEYRLQVAHRMTNDDEVCARYLIEHRERLLPKMLQAATDNREDVDAIVARFARGVHERHTEGLLE